jgi:hypothetical protein
MSSPSYWAVARATIDCDGGCRGRILAGEPVRMVTAGEYPYCVKCSKARFDLDAPAASTIPALPKLRLAFSAASDLARDFKIAQSKDGA